MPRFKSLEQNAMIILVIESHHLEGTDSYKSIG